MTEQEVQRDSKFGRLFPNLTATHSAFSPELFPLFSGGPVGLHFPCTKQGRGRQSPGKKGICPGNLKPPWGASQKELSDTAPRSFLRQYQQVSAGEGGAFSE